MKTNLKYADWSEDADLDAHNAMVQVYDTCMHLPKDYNEDILYSGAFMDACRVFVKRGDEYLVVRDVFKNVGE